MNSLGLKKARYCRAFLLCFMNLISYPECGWQFVPSPGY